MAILGQASGGDRVRIAERAKAGRNRASVFYPLQSSITGASRRWLKPRGRRSGVLTDAKDWRGQWQNRKKQPQQAEEA